MEEYENSNRLSIVESTNDVRRSAHFTLIWAISFATVLLLAILGYAIYLVHSYLIYLGYLVLGAVGIVILCAGFIPVVFLLRAAFTPRYQGVEQYGGYFTTLLGRIVAAPPHSASQSKSFSSPSSKSVKVEPVAPVVPSLFDLIESGDIAHARNDMQMVMGYDKAQLAKGILEVVVGPWPGTHAVAGKGRSGKTRRVIAEVAQALISGAKITICDPHGIKPDSLARSLEPLESRLYRVARGEAQIVEATREFFTEMEARVSGTSTEVLDDVNYIPRLIVYDEWAREMTTDLLSDDDRDLLRKTATSCSSEYAGFNGFCCIISQRWTQETCGGTDIRRSLQAVFCHNINAEFAAFFFRNKKQQYRAEELKRRECLYKDFEGQVREIITLTIPDDTAVRISELMTAQVGTTEEPAQIASPGAQYQSPERHTDPLPVTPYPETYESVPSTLAIPEHAQGSSLSPSPVHAGMSDEQFQELKKILMREQSERVNGLHTPNEVGEGMPLQGEGFTVASTPETAQDDPGYTHEQETMILGAAFQLMKETGKITRSDIMERLGWTRKQWPAIKAVCDRHNIAKQ